MLDAKCAICGTRLEYSEAVERSPDKCFICIDWEACNKRMHQIPEDQKIATKSAYPFRVVNGCDVSLIAQTRYDDLEVMKWCEARGMKFETDALADGDALSEFAGRACYLSFNSDRRRPAPEGKQNSTYLDHIREVGHGSVTEHPSWTFLIDDFSKNCTQELVRHRVGVAFSVQSSRYVDQFSGEYFGDSGHSLGVYIPPEVQEDDTLYNAWINQWLTTVALYRQTYEAMRKRGLDKKDARSIARDIIPGSMCNAVVFTVNARELNHIFRMRGDLPAHQEIRKMALRLYDFVKTDNLFNHWEEQTHPTKGRYLRMKEPDLFERILKILGPNPDSETLSRIADFYKPQVTNAAM